MSDPSHDTPHDTYPQYFVQHAILEQAVEHPGTWLCCFCQCPHIEMPNADGVVAHIVATEPRPCPYSFDNPCPNCGNTYKCEPGCGFMGVLLAMLDDHGAEIEPD